MISNSEISLPDQQLQYLHEEGAIVQAFLYLLYKAGVLAACATMASFLGSSAGQLLQVETGQILYRACSGSMESYRYHGSDFFMAL